MEPHTAEAWEAIIDKTPSPSTETIEETIANRIIGDLIGYSHKSKHRRRDTQELANALVAYARLLQRHGVMV